MRLRSILFTLTALLLVVPRALAQGEIPTEVVERPTLTAADVTLVQKYINERLPNLSNADPLVIKRSRDDLIRSFRNARASVSFRKTFSDNIITELKKLAGDDKDLVAVNALRITGEIATSDATAVLEERLADKKVAVRYAAISGMERTLVAVSTHQPAVTAERVDALITKLGAVIQEKNVSPELASAASRALNKAMAITRAGFPEARAGAFRTLCDSIAKQAQAGADPSMTKVFLSAGETAQAALSENGAPLALTGDSVKQAAGLGGHLIGWAYRQMKAGKLPNNGETRELTAQVVTVAEKIVSLSTNRAGGESIAPQNLGADVAKGNDQAFTRNLVKVIGPLNGPPFNFQADTFLK